MFDMNKFNEIFGQQAVKRTEAKIQTTSNPIKSEVLDQLQQLGKEQACKSTSLKSFHQNS